MRNGVNIFGRRILLMVVAMVGFAAVSAGRLPFSVMGALMKCSQLSSVNLDHITKIGVMALNHTALVEVRIPACMVEIGDYAFGGCRKLKKIEVEPGNAHYSSIDGVLFDKKQTELFRCPEAKAGVLSLPETLVEIRDFACENCKLLNDTLALPGNLQKIGKYAFYGIDHHYTFVDVPFLQLLLPGL